MITIHPNPMRLGCQVCRLDADVIAIDIRADGGNDSTIIRLCPKCRADLLDALPTEQPDPGPTGERRPCGAWEDYGTTSRLAIPHGPAMRVYLWSVDLTWRWYLDGADVSPKNDPVHATKEAAHLAAEDAAAELLTAGLRALGRGGK